MKESKLVRAAMWAGVLVVCLLVVLYTAGNYAAVKVIAPFGIVIGLAVMAMTCRKRKPEADAPPLDLGRRNLLALIPAAVAGILIPRSAEAKQAPYDEVFTMPAADVEATAAKCGARVVWVDNTGSRCAPCLIGLAIVIVVGAIWYAACKADKKHRKLPDDGDAK